MGFSATYAALWAMVACPSSAFLRRNTWITPTKAIEAVRDAAKQAAEVAVPIAAIGIVIAVAIQSNLALKFSGSLIDA
ncbi:hypothetical protein, partial [Tritonibacter sp. SIMBA_163]|uniref:hypothetical protein n=1 Tax=Tritonibacter sp. SIMBA_163 TaxID=3080868 RepID=UPI00397FC5AC